MTARGAAALVVVVVAGCPGPSQTSNEDPVARLRTPALSDARLPVTLDASASSDVDGTVVRFTYLFGDGSPAVSLAESSYRHVFPGAGRYTVRLTVEDDDGATSHLDRQVVLVDAFTPPYCGADADCGERQACEDDGVCWERTP